MQYLLTIYDVESEQSTRGAEHKAAEMAAYQTFTQSIIESGHFQGGNGLQPTSTATSVRVRNGDIQLTDGPFAESREALGGYYLIEAENLDVAVEIASRIPTAKHGTIEVRPVMVFPG